jgi:hypothetical protein
MTRWGISDTCVSPKRKPERRQRGQRREDERKNYVIRKVTDPACSFYDASDDHTRPHDFPDNAMP